MKWWMLGLGLTLVWATGCYTEGTRVMVEVSPGITVEKFGMERHLWRPKRAPEAPHARPRDEGTASPYWPDA